jgi:serine/threonine protein phosphatase 1
VVVEVNREGRNMVSMHASAPARFIASLPAGRRVYAIGDVHGRLDLLHDLFERIRADNAARAPAATEIILLGDLIDRGPDSADVVRWAMVAERGGLRISTVKGNHEASLLSVLDGDMRWLANWLRFGGVETLESWGVPAKISRGKDGAAIIDAVRAVISDAERMWLAQLPLYLSIGDYVFVHAGIRPGTALAEQSEDDLIWIREEFLDSAFDHGAMIVHGHTITTGVTTRHNRIGIDTGAYRSGRLTAIGLERDDRWFLAT